MEDLEADIAETAPDLRRRVSEQLAVIRDYHELDEDAKANPQHRRVRLDAAQRVVDLLEKRRAENREADRLAALESELMDRIRSPRERAEAAAR